MSHVSKVLIACYKLDLDWLRICIASIRFWYPDIPITLLKDISKGDFSTKELERHFGASVYKTDTHNFGWGFSKLEPLVEKEHQRMLVLDTDTVFLGRILDHLDHYQEDFLVTGLQSEDPDSMRIRRDYIKVTETLKELNPDYQYPGYGVNCGQIVITGGHFTRSDLEEVIDYSGELPRAKYPDLLPYADQGVFNYLLANKFHDGLVSVRYLDFWLWSDLDYTKESIRLDSIKKLEGYPFILHWAGTKRFFLSRVSRYDIVRFYENWYYAQLPYGILKKYLRLASKYLQKIGIASKNRFFKYFYQDRRTESLENE